MYKENNFAVYFAGDAYSTDKKIMGRQSAGKSFMKGMARTWPRQDLVGLGPAIGGGKAMASQLKNDGHLGRVHWSPVPNLEPVKKIGALYYPSPAPKDLAHLRNMTDSSGFSLMGVTFTLSSNSATDQVADLILPPFKPWDALICISECAKTFTVKLHQEMKDWWTSQLGPIKFNNPQLPVIFLGVDAPFFAPQPGRKHLARQSLAIADDHCVYLFSGRLSFHAKANPAAMYRALEKAAQKNKIICIEAGVFPSEAIKQSFLLAQKKLAPNVKFLWVDGQDNAKYQQAWQAADVFISLADNIQETFGLTPVEAMAAGMPVIVADWNGYKETVREGVDGFRIPTVLPPEGMGEDLAIRHAMDIDNYDYFIGRVSLSTVVEPLALELAVSKLAAEPLLRESMGQAGLQRVQQVFDWPIILQQYVQLSNELAIIREKDGNMASFPWPQRSDPFKRFADFSTTTLKGNQIINSKVDARARLKDLFELSMVNYGFDSQQLPQQTIWQLLETLETRGNLSVNTLLNDSGSASATGVRCLMWLWKFDLVSVN